MTDRLHTIALMAAQFRIADGMSNVAHPHTEYIAEALALYRQTERAVTEAYRTTSTPSPCSHRGQRASPMRARRRRVSSPMSLGQARVKAQSLWGNSTGYAHYWPSPLGLLCAVGEIKDRDGGFSPYVIAATFEEAFQLCESPATGTVAQPQE